jgi:hypothetical protein
MTWALLDLGLLLGHTYDPVHLGVGLEHLWPHGLSLFGNGMVGPCTLNTKPHRMAAGIWTPMATG